MENKQYKEAFEGFYMEMMGTLGATSRAREENPDDEFIKTINDAYIGVVKRINWWKEKFEGIMNIPKYHYGLGKEVSSHTSSPARRYADSFCQYIDEDLIFTATVQTKPEVELGKYKKLGIKKDKVEVTDDEVEHELGHLKEQFVEVKSLDDKAEAREGDVVVIDFEGFKDGEASDGGKGENYSLEIGSIIQKVKQ